MEFRTRIGYFTQKAGAIVRQQADQVGHQWHVLHVRRPGSWW
jgi:hypothetical protein